MGPKQHDRAKHARKKAARQGATKYSLPPKNGAAPTGAAEGTRLPSLDSPKTVKAQEAAGPHTESQERAAGGKHLAVHPGVGTVR